MIVLKLKKEIMPNDLLKIDEKKLNKELNSLEEAVKKNNHKEIINILKRIIPTINNYDDFFFFGFLGGFIKGVVGLIKHTQSHKDVKIKPGYFLGTLTLPGLIGLAAAWITHDLGIAFLGLEAIPLSIALIIGYAGGDFIENIFKIIIKDDTIFQIGKLLKKELKKKTED